MLDNECKNKLIFCVLNSNKEYISHLILIDSQTHESMALKSFQFMGCIYV